MSFGGALLGFLKEVGKHLGLRAASHISMRGIDRLEKHLMEKQDTRKTTCPACGQEMVVAGRVEAVQCPSCKQTLVVEE